MNWQAGYLCQSMYVCFQVSLNVCPEDFLYVDCVTEDTDLEMRFHPLFQFVSSPVPFTCNNKFAMYFKRVFSFLFDFQS